MTNRLLVNFQPILYQISSNFWSTSSLLPMNLWLTFRPLTKFVPSCSRPPYHILFHFQPTSDRLPFNLQPTSGELLFDFKSIFGQLPVTSTWLPINSQSTSSSPPINVWHTFAQLIVDFQLTSSQLPATSGQLHINFISNSYQIPPKFWKTSGQLQVNFLSTYGPLPDTCYMYKLAGSIYLFKTHITSFYLQHLNSGYHDVTWCDWLPANFWLNSSELPTDFHSISDNFWSASGKLPTNFRSPPC